MINLKFSPHVRPDRAVISIRGEGGLAFLHNLLTCDVVGLAMGEAAYGALLSPQGKILHDFFVFNAGESVLLDCAASQRAALLQKLMLYKLRAKLEIAARDDLEVAVGTEGYADSRNAQLGHRFFAAAGSFKSGEGYDAARIALGLADSEQDIGSGVLFSHEANFDLIGGVSFSKGCYVGQEVVSRMQHRGTARSRILPVASMGKLPAPQTAITSGETAIGTLLSNDGTLGIALIRIDRWNAATAPIMAGTVAISLRTLSWFPTSISEPATL